MSFCAAERIVMEQRETREGSQEQAQQDGERLDPGKRQPEPALSAHSLLSKRSAQIIGRLCHGTPRISRADDTTTRQNRGLRRHFGLAQSGAPKAAGTAPRRT